MNTLRHLCISLVLPAIGTAWLSAAVGSGKPVRTEAEVREAGRQAVARYSDASLAAQGFLDVTKAPYLADPTGKIDATAAIQQALQDARDAQLVTYLPAGRYLVSDTIEGIVGTVKWDRWPYEGWSDPWVAFASFNYPCVLVGPATGGRATLVLADGASGFGDPKAPKPVLYFWARSESGPEPEPEVPQPNINFNQKIISVDFDLGTGNSGAVAIDHRGAEGSTIEDVSIQAAGAFAGIRHAPGSGGAMHGIRVQGGRFGLYLPGSQPSPLVSDLTLSGQSEAAIYYRGRGPLTVVGAEISGAPVRAEAGMAGQWEGPINLIGTVIRRAGSGPAVESERSLLLENVWFENAAVAAVVAGQPPLPGRGDGWTHVQRYAAGGNATLPKFLGGASHRDPLWINGGVQTEPFTRLGPPAPPPNGWRQRHRFPAPPDWFGKGVANVRAAPWNAAGDDRHDDTRAIQAAIDATDAVFLPKGVYRISQPLRLRSTTRLFGVTNLVSVLAPLPGAAAFANPDVPQPLVETVDDPRASTRLEMMKLELPVLNPCVYALRWRAGRESVVRNLYPIRTAWHPNAPVIGQPMIVIEGNGGGRWYTQTLLGWWGQGPDYRHLMVRGTREPLCFYHLQPQHARGEVMVEMADVENVDIFSMKAESCYGLLALKDSRHVRIIGYSGNASLRPGWALFRLDHVEDVMLGGIYPQLARPGGGGALHIGFDARQWQILRDGARTIGGAEQFVLYER
ncbi:MAG: hypothetical protein KBA71_10315 [Opitutaceae bacterium]|nr:hypothetical protein [Opitutaceae bacterium]